MRKPFGSLITYSILLLCLVVSLAVAGLAISAFAQRKNPKINIRALGVVKIDKQISCYNGKAGQEVKGKKKQKKINFISLQKYFENLNKGAELSKKQINAIKRGKVVCQKLTQQEIIFVDRELKSKSCPGNKYSISKRDCSEKNGKKNGKAVKSFREAFKSAGPGDTIFIRGSKSAYSEAFLVTRGGIAGFPLTISGYPGENVILDGQGKLSFGIKILPLKGQKEGADFVRVQNLTLTNFAKNGSAILLGNSKGSEISNVHIFASHSEGIRLENGSSAIVVKDNLIHGLDQTAVTIIGENGHKLNRNIVYALKSDAFVVKSGPSKSPVLFSYNIAFGNRGAGFSIYTASVDGKASEFFHNLSFGNSGAGLAVSGKFSPGLAVKNNILADNGVRDLDYAVQTVALSNYNFVGDGVFDSTFSPQTKSGTLVFFDGGQFAKEIKASESPASLGQFGRPLDFASAESLILMTKESLFTLFRLPQDSPLIDGGFDLGRGFTDLLGTGAEGNYDVGPFEFGSRGNNGGGGGNGGGNNGGGGGNNGGPTPTPLPTPTPSATPTPTPAPTPTPEPGNPLKAPPNDPTTPTDFAKSVEFLYTGDNPVQTGVAPGTIEERRVAVLRGKVIDETGAALPGVTVTVLNHPEFGKTVTRDDGAYDMAANGGGNLVFEFERNGFLTSQRQILTRWREFGHIPDVALVTLDSNVSKIKLPEISEVAVARGSVITDDDGNGNGPQTRQATVLFPPGTGATMVLPDGTKESLTEISVRATEYTVGPNGPKRMPATLPPTSAYTYAVELSVDEAIAKGAVSVEFSKLIPFYVDNFLKFPVGMAVPVGYYDRVRAVWVPSDNGVVLKVLSVDEAGLAVLDVKGKGSPATSQELEALGITDEERKSLGSLYSAGAELWRVQFGHFTPWDCNWPYGPPDDAEPPNGDDPKSEDELQPDDHCHAEGSDIFCESQGLGQQIPITGTPFKLVYSSRRVPGRKTGRFLNVSLVGNSFPKSVKRVDIEIMAAGKLTTESFEPNSGKSMNFLWSGTDAYDRPVQGIVNATVKIGFVYQAVYRKPADLQRSFGQYGNALTGNRTRSEVTLWKQSRTQVARFDASKNAIAGWNLDVAHSYDLTEGAVYFGDGGKRGGRSLKGVVQTIAGTGESGDSGDGGLATLAKIKSPFPYLAVGEDGSIFVSDTHANRVRKIRPDGIIEGYAGTGEEGYAGDGGLATEARLNRPTAIALDANGALFIKDSANFRIRKVDSRGIISTIAGNGTNSFPKDGDNALDSGLPNGFGDSLAVDSDGNIFVYVEYDNKGATFKISSDGKLSKIDSEDNSGISVGSDGSLFLRGSTAKEQYVCTVRRISPDGIKSIFVGQEWPENCGYSGDGGLAIKAKIGFPLFSSPVGVGPDGFIYLSDISKGRIRRISPDGIITTFAGKAGGLSPDGTSLGAMKMWPVTLATAPDNSVIFIDGDARYQIRRLISYSLDKVGVPHTVSSKDGSLLYIFNSSGRHLETRNALTGAPVFKFAYNDKGRLISVTDGDSKITTINYDKDDKPTSIVGPFGQTTTIHLEENGYIRELDHPDGSKHKFDYWPVDVEKGVGAGLLKSFTTPNNGVHKFDYDDLGRLKNDSDAEDKAQVLVRIGDPLTFDVKRSTPLGRSTTYSVENRKTGEVWRQVKSPDGTKSQLLEGLDSTFKTTRADGTVSLRTEGPDPRLKMQSPITAELVQTTPSNLSYKRSATREVELEDPNDILSLKTQIDTITINEKIFTSIYDAANKTYSLTTPKKRKIAATTDIQSRPTGLTITGFEPLTWGYDSKGRLTSSSTGTGDAKRESAFYYDQNGYLDFIVDPENRSTDYDFDFSGKLEQLTYPDGRVVSFTYDKAGNLTSLTPPKKPKHEFKYTLREFLEEYIPPKLGGRSLNTTFHYNEDKDLDLITRPDGKTVTYEYDSAGRVSAEKTPLGDTIFNYDSKTGKVNKITAPNKQELSFTYDGFLLLNTELKGDVAGTVKRAYDNNFRMKSRTINTGSAILFSYDDDGYLEKAGEISFARNSDNGSLTGASLGSLTESFGYNGFAELKSSEAKFKGNTIFRATYETDKLGRLTSKTQHTTTYDNEYSYTYYPSGFLKSVTKNGVLEEFEFDDNGNRLKIGGSDAYYDDQDRLTEFGDTLYSYTDNGERATKSVGDETTSYDYDVMGALRAVQLPDGKTIEYIVDPLGSRIGKKINGKIVQGFLYQDNLRPAAELDASNKVVSTFIYGTRTNVPEYMIKDAKTYRIITDHLGSVRFVVNSSSGEIAQEIEYDTWGRVTRDTNPGFQPFGFAGGLYDPDTGLTRFGARDYDPEIGRWTAKDPIGFAGGDTNLYGYVLGDPVNFVDPEGLAPDDIEGHLESPGFFQDPLNLIGIAILGKGAIGAANGLGNLIDDLLHPTNQGGGGSGGGSCPNIPYPGDDGSKVPDGYEWRGKPDSRPGDRRGGYFNPITKESLRPDLDHPAPIGPHWDYGDSDKRKYRVFPDGRIEPKK